MKASRLVLLMVPLVLLGLTWFITGEPAGEQVLVVGRGSDAITLDPANATDGESARVTVNLYETLVEYHPDSLEIRPGLATGWSVSDDHRTWTFYLRPGVRFHDGTQFNAEAVVFNFQRWMDPNHPFHQGNFPYWGYMFGGYPGLVTRVEAAGPLEVRITLAEPMAAFLANLANFSFGIASPAAIGKYGKDFGRHPVGTGPFRLEEWVEGASITLVANPDYWGGRPRLQRVVFRTLPDNGERFQALLKGDIDVADGLNAEDLAQARNQPSLLRIMLRPSLNVGYLAMNNDRWPFQDARVRQAINYAVNKDWLVNNYFGGLAKEAKNPLPPSVWGYNDSIRPYPYDPDMARKLLAEAGLAAGFSTTLWAMANPRPYMPQPLELARAIAADLEEVGIRVRIVTYDWPVYIRKLQNGEHDMALLGWTGDTGDPGNFLYVLLDKTNAEKGRAGNVAFYRSEQVHNLLAAAQTETNKQVRAGLYARAQEIIHQDAPWVPLVHTTPAVVARRGVRGYVPHATGVERLHNVYVLD